MHCWSCTPSRQTSNGGYIYIEEKETACTHVHIYENTCLQCWRTSWSELCSRREFHFTFNGLLSSLGSNCLPLVYVSMYFFSFP